MIHKEGIEDLKHALEQMRKPTSLLSSLSLSLSLLSSLPLSPPLL